MTPYGWFNDSQEFNADRILLLNLLYVDMDHTKKINKLYELISKTTSSLDISSDDQFS